MSFAVYLYIYELCSFSKLSVTSSTSQFNLQPFRRFTYITAHSTTLPLFHLCHSSFSNSSFASPMSQALHLIHLVSRPWSRGNTVASHLADPSSIPGWVSFPKQNILLLSLNKFATLFASFVEWQTISFTKKYHPKGCRLQQFSKQNTSLSIYGRGIQPAARGPPAALGRILCAPGKVCHKIQCVMSFEV